MINSPHISSYLIDPGTGKPSIIPADIMTNPPKTLSYLIDPKTNQLSRMSHLLKDELLAAAEDGFGDTIMHPAYERALSEETARILGMEDKPDCEPWEPILGVTTRVCPASPRIVECRITESSFARLGTYGILGGNPITLADDSLVTRYAILQFSETYHAELIAAPSGVGGKKYPFRIKRLSNVLAALLCSSMKLRSICLKKSYKLSAVNISTIAMQDPHVSKYYFQCLVQALWALIDTVRLEWAFVKKCHGDQFNMHRFSCGVNKALRKTRFLTITMNPDGTLALVRPPFFNATKHKLVSFHQLTECFTRSVDPLSLFRPWQEPADVVVDWWSKHVPQHPKQFLWTKSDFDLMRILATVPGYLCEKDMKKLVRHQDLL